MRFSALASVLTLAFSLPAQAAVYDFSYTDAGAIPQDGSTFSVEHDVSVLGAEISSFTVTFTFANGASLTGDATGIQGVLTLGTSASSPFINFNPVASYAGVGSQRIYSATFAGTPSASGSSVGFSGLNPNTTWSVMFYDKSSSGIENSLTGWSLQIEAVPEPANAALAVFGGLFAAGLVVHRLRARARTHA